jgi:hypothetical protein
VSRVGDRDGERFVSPSERIRTACERDGLELIDTLDHRKVPGLRRLFSVMVLERRKTRARRNTLGGGAQTTRPHARSLTRFRVSLPIALMLFFVVAYLAAIVKQAIELIR